MRIRERAGLVGPAPAIVQTVPSSLVAFPLIARARVLLPVLLILLVAGLGRRVEALNEACPDLAGRLLDQGALRRLDHPLDHVPADRAGVTGREITPVPPLNLRSVDVQFVRHLVTQSFQGLARLDDNRAIAVVTA